MSSRKHSLPSHSSRDAIEGSGWTPGELVATAYRVLAHRGLAEDVLGMHPPAVVATDLAGLALRPIVGAYNIPAMRMASEGIPVYPRAVLINNDDLARELVEALGDAPVCLLRGHGIVATGASVEQAVVRALNLNALAEMTLAANRYGTKPAELSTTDIESLPDHGTEFNDRSVWAIQVARLDHAGLGLRPATG